jgi:hypothetical protein
MMLGMFDQSWRQAAVQHGLSADPRPFVALLDMLGILKTKTDLLMPESGAGG